MCGVCACVRRHPTSVIAAGTGAPPAASGTKPLSQATMTHRLTHPYTLHSAVIQSEIKNRTTSYVSPAMRAQAETLVCPPDLVHLISSRNWRSAHEDGNEGAQHARPGLCAIDAASDYRLPTSAHLPAPEASEFPPASSGPIRAGHVRSSMSSTWPESTRAHHHACPRVCRVPAPPVSRSERCTACRISRARSCSTRLSVHFVDPGLSRSLKSESNNGI